MKIVFSQKCLQFGKSGHPESAQRLNSCYEYLKRKSFQFQQPSPCSEADILCVHSPKLLIQVKENSFSDPDTPRLDNIFEYARLAAGAAILACEIAQKEGAAFSLMRPPGHHAGFGQLGGFCYFNNLAIAAERLRKKSKVAIIDFDCHHGNGTQDIFLGKDNIIYLSLHQSPFYPGTGLLSEKNCINFPLAAGTQESEYLEVFEEGLSRVREFNPDFLAVSAGFDTYRRDPLGGIKLDIATYRKIGQIIAGFKRPFFAVLEGGYSSKLASCVYEFISGF